MEAQDRIPRELPARVMEARAQKRRASGQALLRAGVSESAIVIEERSTNTLENVLFTIQLLNALCATPGSLLFYCKSHHAGRVQRTLSKYLPDVILSCATYDAVYGGTSVSASNW